MARKDTLGRWGEEHATQRLRERGFEILDRNWRCPSGEVDIVATTGDHLVIVEVKTRRTAGFGHPFEAVDALKSARLWRLARAWALAHPEDARSRLLRVDVIGITGDDPATALVEYLEDLR